jgi:TolB-like protein
MVHSRKVLLRQTANHKTGKMDKPENRPIIQSSFGDLNGASTVIPYSNGLSNGIIRAF